MSDRDLPNMDDVELPDIPDDDEMAAAEEGEDAQGGDSDGENGGGPPAGLLAKLAPIAGMLAGIVAPILAILAPLVSKVTTPLAGVAAPVGKVLAPVATILAPLLARVPRPILVGVGSFAGILVVVVLFASLLGGSRGSAEASAAVVKSAPLKSSAPLSDLPKAPPTPVYTPTPAGPTATPTPAAFAQLGKGWVGVGMAMPNPRQKLIPERMLFFEDPRDTYRLVANVSVLLQSGPLAPLWGIVLGYEDELNHLRLEFFSDSYDRNRPYVGLFLTKNGESKLAGPTARLPTAEFWGRDVHEIVVDVAQPEIVATMNGDLLGRWAYPGRIVAAKKALYVWGGSRIRFDAVRID